MLEAEVEIEVEDSIVFEDCVDLRKLDMGSDAALLLDIGTKTPALEVLFLPIEDAL